jgi:putative transcriptional regulator
MKNKIKELRHQHGISQTALAEAVGTTKRTIYAIETENKDIHISLAHKLATHFGCGIDDLLIYEDGTHTTADKAMWLVNVVRYTAAEIDKSIDETTRLFERNGLAQRLLAGYNVWHTQGYEYMAEVMSEALESNQQGV